MASDDQVPMLERAELPEIPTIPKETAREIALLEREFVDAEVKALRSSIPLLRPLYTRRSALITSKLAQSDFWPRVFAAAPEEIDNYILPSDAEIIGRLLKNLTVERFSVNEKGDAGEPRNLRFIFEFDTASEDNEWIEGDGKLVKEFYWRKSVWKSEKSGKRRVWEGLVSEPVRINWKKPEADPTKGLLGVACDLADAEKKVAKNGKVTAEQRLELPEYEKLVKEVAKVEAEAALHAECEGEDHDHDHDHDDSPAGMSFFAWFGYRGRDISAEESEAAVKDDDEYFGKIARGEKVEGDDEKEGEDDDDDEDYEDDDEDGLMDAEVFPDGDDLAIALSEDLWENALKYYVQSFEDADAFDSDIDIDMDDDEDDDDDDEAQRPRKKSKA